jgi:molybdopterin-biosynthesis enzyme MoeA-like protein
MNNFIAIGFVIFIILIVIKFFYPASQDTFEIQDLKESEIADQVNQLSDEYHIVVNESLSEENINEPDESIDVTDKLENEKTVIVQTTKNKWLYPDDEFGKMERGRSF